MRAILLASFGAVIFATGAAAQGYSCRAQVLFTCKESCEVSQMPADLGLDLKTKSGSFCRGSRCDEGVLTISDHKGQWDDVTYRAFSLVNKGANGYAFSVAGVINLKTNAFYAKNSDIEDMFGTCVSGK